MAQGKIDRNGDLHEPPGSEKGGNYAPKNGRKTVNDSAQEPGQPKTYEFNPPKHIEVLPANDVKNVTSQEWARFYTALGYIQAGTLTPMKTEKGETVIRIDNKLFFNSGTYGKPKVNKVYLFDSEDEIDNFIYIFKKNGVLK